MNKKRKVIDYIAQQLKRIKMQQFSGHKKSVREPKTTGQTVSKNGHIGGKEEKFNKKGKKAA